MPGISEIQVSSHGMVKAWETKNRRWSPAFLPGQSPAGYRYFVHRGKRYAVHQLVALTYIGAPSDPTQTVDHIQKYNGDFKKERGDNRSHNLRWATKKEQRANSVHSNVRRDARNVVVWKFGENKQSGVVYPSCSRAAKLLGLDEANLSRVARGQRRSIKGFCAELVDDSKEFEGEEFRCFEGFMVSQYGRVISQSGLPITPHSNNNKYPRVQHNGIDRPFHYVVAKAWSDIVGDQPEDESFTIDHIDRNIANNAATNLRWASQSEQKKNQTRKSKYQIMARRKVPIAVKPANSSGWINFESIHYAAEFMTIQLGRIIKDSTVSRAVCEKPKGYKFKRRNAKGWSVKLLPSGCAGTN